MASPQKDVEKKTAHDEANKVLADQNLGYFLSKNAGDAVVSRKSDGAEITLDQTDLANIEALEALHAKVLEINHALEAKTLTVEGLNEAQIGTLNTFIAKFKELNDAVFSKLSAAAAALKPAAALSPTRAPAGGKGAGRGKGGAASPSTPPAAPLAAPAPTPLGAGQSTQAPPLSPVLSPVQVGSAAASVTTASGTVVARATTVDGASATAAVGGSADAIPSSDSDADAPQAPETPPARPIGRKPASTGRAASSTSDDERNTGPTPELPVGHTAVDLAGAERTAAQLAAEGQRKLEQGQKALAAAASEDGHRIEDEQNAATAAFDANAADADRQEHVKRAQTAKATAEVLQNLQQQAREQQDEETIKAAEAGREGKNAGLKQKKAEASAAEHAIKAAKLHAEGATDLTRGTRTLTDAAEIFEGTSEAHQQEAIADADKAAALRTQAAASVQASSHAVAAPAASTPASSPKLTVVPSALPTADAPVTGASTAEKKDEQKGLDVKDAKSALCKQHPVKRTLDKKVVGALIAAGAVTLTTGAVLFAPQYVLYVGSVALAQLGIHATILAAKITGSLLITAATAAALTGIVAAVNAVMNYLHTGTKVKAVVKGATGTDVTATAQATDADGHTVTATATADVSAAPTSSKGVVGYVREAFGLLGSRKVAVTASAPAAASVEPSDQPRRSSVSAGASSQ